MRSLLLVSLLLLAGCATFPVNGLLYSDVVAPGTATSNQAGVRVGEACAKSFLGLFAWGDAGIETARRNGGITLITSVDQSVAGSPLFYARYCTIVRGR